MAVYQASNAKIFHLSYNFNLLSVSLIESIPPPPPPSLIGPQGLLWVLWSIQISSRMGMSPLFTWAMIPWCQSRCSRAHRRKQNMESSAIPLIWLASAMAQKSPAAKVAGSMYCIRPLSCGPSTCLTAHKFFTPQTSLTSPWCWSSSQGPLSASQVRRA